MSQPRAFTLLDTADAALAAALLLGCLPETVIDKPRLGPVPLVFLLLDYALVVNAFAWLARRAGLRATVGAVLLGAAYMAWLAVWRHNELRWAAIDASMLAALLCGLCWGAVHEFDGAASLFRRIFYAAAAAALVTMVLRVLKVIEAEPFYLSGRANFLYSLGYAAGLLTITTPWMMLDAARQTCRLTTAALLGLGLILAIGFFTSSRTELLQIALVLMLFWRCRVACFRWWKGVLAALLLAVLASVGALYLADINADIQDSMLLKRALNTNLLREERVTELESMFRQLDGAELFVGRGLGARFESPVLKDRGEPLALSPHLGGFTLVFKGGLFCYALFVVAPLLLALGVAGSLAPKGIRLVLPASFIVIMVCAGGPNWDPVGMFLYGVCLALLLKRVTWRAAAPAPACSLQVH